MENSRLTAIELLISVEKDKAYSNIVLNKILSKSKLNKNDRALASAIFYGVLDRKLTIDYILSQYIKTPLKKLKPITYQALSIAVYQIYFMDKIPESAAVNESVNIVKFSKEKYNSSFVNAVLRNIIRNPAEIPTDESITSLSIRYSCPEDIIKSFICDYGKENAEKILNSALIKPGVTLRVNELKCDRNELISILADENISAKPNPLSKSAIDIVGSVDISASDAYKQGLFHVQDIASQLCAETLGAKSGEKIADMCAAPGGKSFTIAEIMKNEGQIFSFDIYQKKIELICSGARRLGLSIIKAALADATVKKNETDFDAVLCDVPCSGLGVIRRKPEIKYKGIQDYSQLEQIQRTILENAASMLKPGGRLLYSTCTLRNAENNAQIQFFLDNHSGYALKYEHTFMPQSDLSDGFYCALIVKAGESY